MYTEWISNFRAFLMREGNGRKVFAAAIFLVFLAFFSLYSGKSDEDNLMSEVSDIGTEHKPDHASKHLAVKGAERQIARSELKNPFSETHDVRASVVHDVNAGASDGKADAQKAPPREAVAAENKAAPPADRSVAASSASPAAVGAVVPAPARNAVLLHGIVRGDNGALALLSVGSSSAPLAVGESLAGVRVLNIGFDTVSVDGADGSSMLHIVP